MPNPTPPADAGGALWLALGHLAPVMISQSVHAEIVAPPGLWVRMRSSTLIELLEDLLATSVRLAPTSRLLVIAAQYGNQVHISVADDMPGVHASVRRASVRGLQERVAACGGQLDVDVQPAEGTTLTLRLAAARPDRADHPVQNTSPNASSVITGSALSP